MLNIGKKDSSSPFFRRHSLALLETQCTENQRLCWMLRGIKIDDRHGDTDDIPVSGTISINVGRPSNVAPSLVLSEPRMLRRLALFSPESPISVPSALDTFPWTGKNQTKMISEERTILCTLLHGE